jgi:hypothetical protein
VPKRRRRPACITALEREMSRLRVGRDSVGGAVGRLSKAGAGSGGVGTEDGEGPSGGSMADDWIRQERRVALRERARRRRWRVAVMMTVAGYVDSAATGHGQRPCANWFTPFDDRVVCR